MSIEQKFDRSIVEGPILKAVWKLAWPTMLQNMAAGIQGIIDHTMVGHLVGYTGNAAIGISWQIFLVVLVFISSLYSGMGVLVARFVGANEKEKVNRTVYQVVLASIVMACCILAPIGYFLAPALLDLVNAAPAVKAEALPYLRIMFVFSVGKMLFFMLGGALRAAGDAKTPLRLGLAVTILNITANIILIRGLGPIPALGTMGAAIGTVTAMCTISLYGLYLLFSNKLVIRFPPGMSLRPDFTIIKKLFQFGLPTGFQGVIVNIGGVLLLRFIGSLPDSAETQAVYTVGYTQLFSLITWSSVGLMGATAAVAGQNLGAGKPERTQKSTSRAAFIGLTLASIVSSLFFFIPTTLLGFFGMVDGKVVDNGIELLQYLAVSGFFVTVALAYTGGLQGTGDTRSPMFISLISQAVIPLGICAAFQYFSTLQAGHIWMAIVCGHFLRATLSILRFEQGKWKRIKVDLEPKARTA